MYVIYIYPSYQIAVIDPNFGTPPSLPPSALEKSGGPRVPHSLHDLNRIKVRIRAKA